MGARGSGCHHVIAIYASIMTKPLWNHHSFVFVFDGLISYLIFLGHFIYLVIEKSPDF